MRMPILFCLSALVGAAPLSAQQSITSQYRTTADSIIALARTDSSAWNTLVETMAERTGARERTMRASAPPHCMRERCQFVSCDIRPDA